MDMTGPTSAPDADRTGDLGPFRWLPADPDTTANQLDVVRLAARRAAPVYSGTASEPAASTAEPGAPNRRRARRRPPGPVRRFFDELFRPYEFKPQPGAAPAEKEDRS